MLLSCVLAGCGGTRTDRSADTADTATGPEADRRASIAETAAEIDRAVADHGGSWDAWNRRTEPFRADLARITRGKWPWPATKDFVFLGRSARLLMLESWANRPPDQRPWEAVVTLNQQLRSRGIDLIFMPIPDKIAVYPDYISDKAPADRAVSWQARRVLRRLCDEGVEVIDLYSDYRKARCELGDQTPLYYGRDSHWRNRAAVIAAEVIAERLKRYDCVKRALANGSPYEAKPFVRNRGSHKQDDVLRVQRRADGKPYKDAASSPVVVTGDSFALYNMHLNGHLPAHVARLIGMPVTFLAREGLAQSMPVELASKQKRGNFLEGRRVIVWTVRGRSLVEKNWSTVELPGKPAEADLDAVTAMPATGKIVEVSPGPDADSEYSDYVMKLRVTNLRDSDGWQIRQGQAVVRVLAMKGHKILPAAGLEAGRKVSLKLTTWSAVEPRWGRTNTGSIADAKAEAHLPHFWGELIER